jgi:hypothetical protein
VTSVIVDPDDHRMVWAGVEIDGVFRSLDSGDTWTHLKTGLYDPDIHAVTIAATRPKRLYASTAREVFTSNNLGETWQPLDIREKWPLPYARGLMVKADDPGVLFAGCGETTTGEKGHVLRTTNFGESWEILPLPTQPNATVWGLATHPANANRIVAFSLFGEVYVSEDAGASWRKIAREFGEIRAAAWVPTDFVPAGTVRRFSPSINPGCPAIANPLPPTARRPERSQVFSRCPGVGVIGVTAQLRRYRPFPATLLNRAFDRRRSLRPLAAGNKLLVIRANTRARA